MNHKNVLLTFTATILAGCSLLEFEKAPPPEAPITAEPFVSIVPKDLVSNTESILKGVKIKSSFENIIIDSDNKYYNRISSVKILEKNNDLVTTVCEGRIHKEYGYRQQSCFMIDARVSINEKPDSYELLITPYRTRSVQGKDALSIPFRVPVVSIDQWYSWISNQEVQIKHQIARKYSPEELMTKFDRSPLLQTINKNNYGEHKVSQGVGRQYISDYKTNLGPDIISEVYSEYFVYKGGAKAEFTISAKLNNTHTRTINWNNVLKSFMAKLDNIASS